MLHSVNASLVTETPEIPKQAYGLLRATGCRLAHALFSIFGNPSVPETAFGHMGVHRGTKRLPKAAHYSEVTLLHSVDAPLVTETPEIPKQAYGLLRATGCRLTHALFSNTS